MIRKTSETMTNLVTEQTVGASKNQRQAAETQINRSQQDTGQQQNSNRQMQYQYVPDK